MISNIHKIFHNFAAVVNKRNTNTENTFFFHFTPYSPLITFKMRKFYGHNYLEEISAEGSRIY